MSKPGQHAELLSFKEDAIRTAFGLTRNRFDAEDVVQEAYIKAFRYAGHFSSKTAKRAWFLQVVLNQAKDHCLREQRRRRGEGKAGVRAPDVPRLSVKVEQRERRQMVSRALAFIEEKFRLPVTMHYEKGLTYPEIDAELDMPTSTARVYAHRGIQKIRKVLGQWRTAAGVGCMLVMICSLHQPAFADGWAL